MIMKSDKKSPKRSKSFKTSSKASDGKSGKNKDYFKNNKVMKFTPLDFRSNSTQATYIQVKEALIIEIEKTFDYGADALSHVHRGRSGVCDPTTTTTSI